MSLASKVNYPAIDNLVESSLESENKYLRLELISCSDITDIEPTPTDAIYYAIRKDDDDEEVDEVPITLVFLGSNETCMPTLVSEFARIYSLPTHKYTSVDSCFRRYSEWLEY